MSTGTAGLQNIASCIPTYVMELSQHVLLTYFNTTDDLAI